MCTNLPPPTNYEPIIEDEKIEINAVFICWGTTNRKFSHYEVVRFGNEVYAFYHGVSTHFTDADTLTRLLYLGYNLKMNTVLSEVCLLDFVEFTASKAFK